MFQITVYVGAVAVLVIFTVMLVRTQALFSRKEDRGRKTAGIILMLIFMGGMGGIVLYSGFNNQGFGDAESPPIDFRAIGTEMLTYYAPALVVIGLTLAGSIIGALSLARREDISQKDDRTS
jgi:NADH:ubiquinone oxidoreductase subunit 6 (subunit J)